MEIIEYKTFLNEIRSLHSDQEIHDYILRKLDLLELKNRKVTISLVDDDFVDEFIGYTSPILPSLLMEPFYMNDNSIYFDFIKQIQNKEMSMLRNIFEEIQTFVESRFGFKGDPVHHNKVYSQSDKEDISIRDFYYNDSALCSERTAVVQNLAEFCNIDSHLIFGKVAFGEHVEAHAFNIFQFGDDLLFYDVTNPVCLNRDGSIFYVPAYNVMSEHDLTKIERYQFDFIQLMYIYKLPIHKDETYRYYEIHYYKND